MLAIQKVTLTQLWNLRGVIQPLLTRIADCIAAIWKRICETIQSFLNRKTTSLPPVVPLLPQSLKTSDIAPPLEVKKPSIAEIPKTIINDTLAKFNSWSATAKLYKSMRRTLEEAEREHLQTLKTQYEESASLALLGQKIEWSKKADEIRTQQFLLDQLTQKLLNP